MSVALLVSFSIRAWALDRPELPSGYVSKNFTVEDGLLSNNVETVLQTRDGFLWIGTPDGLLRFDGRHFTLIKFLPQDSPILISALVEAPDGALWVGTRGGLARIANPGSSEPGRTASLYHPGSGDGDWIQCLYFSRDGDFWVGTLTGLYRFVHGEFITIIPKLWTSRIEEASNGHLLVITSKGFVEWDGKHIIRHLELPARLGVAQHKIFHVIEDHAGTIWYCTTAGVARQRGGSIERLKPYGGTSDRNVVYRLYEDPQGTVWFAQSGELYQATAAGRVPIASNLNATYLASDRDGDLWAGTRTRGLFRLKSQAVKMFTAADGLPLGVPMAVLAASDGKLWVANYCGGLSRFDGRRFQTYADKDGLTNSCVFSIAEDHNQDILIGTHGGGVFRFRDGHFIPVSAPDRLTNRVVTAIVPAKNGPLWIAYSDGLDRIADGKVRRFTTADGLSSNSLLSAFEDRRGVLWVETTRGIDRLKEDHFIAVLTADSASTEAGRFGFGEDRFGDLFAFGPATATFQIQEDRAIRLNGAPRITGMAQSPENLWFCGDGISRATPDSLQKWERERDAPPDYVRFNRADGMNSTDCSGGFRNMAVTNDGRLWVATEQGIAMLEFSRLHHTDRKPAIFLERIVIGKTVQPPGRELILPAGTNRVELHFDTIELASPEAIRLQYRLDGVDREWLDADSSVTAVYSGIPVGTHPFHVRASNSDGVWDRTGIVYDVTQTPYFYETNLFRVAAIAMFAGSSLMLFWALYRFRLGHVAREFNVRLEERTRIARELHDTLLQSFQGVMLRFQIVENLLPAGKAKQELEVALNRADRAIVEGRDAIQHIRSSTLVNNQLTEAIRGLGDELASEHSTEFHLVIEGAQRSLHPILRGEVYQIACEAVRNAFRHAQANRIEVEICYSELQFRLRIRDDGRGIPSAVMQKGRSGHYGLQGIRERAKGIGGELKIWSGAGTEIELKIPGPIAYGTFRAHVLGLFRKKAATISRLAQDQEKL